MSERFSLDGCSAIITGASSGLGVEFARQLAGRAKALCLVARREAELEQTRAALHAINPGLTVVLCVADVSSDAGREKILAAAGELTPPPNVLINNAGVGDYGRFDSASADRLRQQLDVNITGLVLLTHGIIPLLRRPGGILNVSSLAGTVFMPELAVYAATKSFVTSLTEALRLELAGQGISVSAVCPGPTPTNFGKNSRRDSGEDTNRSGQGALRQPPERVVRDGLLTLESGAALVYPGLMVTLAGWLFRVMPRAILRWVMGRRMTSQSD